MWEVATHPDIVSIMNLLPISHIFGSGGWIMILFFGVALFLLSREVLAWYWKINKIINLLEKIEENTRPVDKKRVGDEDLERVISR